MARRAAQPTANHAATPGYPTSIGNGYGPDYDYPRRPPRPPQRRRFIDYPRSARTGWTRWIPSWKLVLALLGILFAMLLVTFFAAYAATSLPSEDQLAKAQTTIFYYADGKAEIGRIGVQNRQNVGYEKFTPQVRNAVLAAEDRTFFENSGVSPTSILRAAWSNAQGNSLQGGSTITQQYVKNVFDLRDRSLKRKVKEFFIALKISHSTPKQQILTTYLNTIYFGRGCYGVQAAAHSYFGRDVNRLNISQAAFLAGIINGPELYDPQDGPASLARAKARWNYVLDGMVTIGALTPAERATQVFPKTNKPSRQNSFAGVNGYLMTMAENEAAQDLKITKDELERGGYKIVTTFGPGLVQQAKQAVKDGLPSAKSQPKGLHVAMATIDPNTGAVLSIYGGADYLDRNQNAATQDVAQAGSTFKPFALIAALEDGVSLRTRFDGHSPQTIEDYPVENFGNEQFSDINLIKATAFSVNTVYARLNQQIGPERTERAAIAAGLPKDTSGLTATLSNVLGPSSPHPIDMASAYSTLAAKGVRHPWYCIKTIYSLQTGKPVPYDRSRYQPKQVFQPDHVADATYAMQQVVQLRGATGGYARNLDRPVAGKTGTSTDSRSAWFVGFTPQLVTAVAMYQIGPNGEEEKMKPFGGVSSIVGGGYPTRIWTEFMKDALDGKPKLDFPEPSYTGDSSDGDTSSQPTQQTVTAVPTTPNNQPTTAPTITATATEPSPTRTRRRTPRPTLPSVTVTKATR